jgi:hypothetical protein
MTSLYLGGFAPFERLIAAPAILVGNSPRGPIRARLEQH